MSDAARPMAKLPAAGLSWARAVPLPRDAARWLPQAISHRGYKARFPENSMAAFRGAVRAGAHAIETDVHLSADGIAVLSHDSTLKRCFGIPRRICDCDWDYLAGLRTLDGDPPQAMPRLRDLLAWLAAEPPEPSDSDSDSDWEQDAKEAGGQDAALAEHCRSRIWILLDIKMDDDPDLLLDAIATALSQVPPGAVPWKQRIMLGCWNASTILAARRALPDFPLAHIGFSLSYAQHFLPTLPGLALNMAHNTLVTPWRGPSFLRTVRDRPVFAWTVNTEHAMRWALTRNLDASAPAGCAEQQDEQQHEKRPVLVDGVVTDDPAHYLDLCRRYEEELDGVRSAPLPATPEPSPLTSAFHFCLDRLRFKLLFLYRRFWLRKLDYLR